MANFTVTASVADPSSGTDVDDPDSATTSDAVSSSVTVAVTVWSANALYLVSVEEGFSVIVADLESPALSMLSFWPCTLTVWAVFQLDVVNVRSSEAV